MQCGRAFAVRSSFILQILIAEDNPADVRLIQEALRPLSIPVKIHVAEDGEEAMDFLTGNGNFAGSPRPNLVFLDFHLPKADPREILRFIKESKELGEVPVCVLTTSNTEELIQEAYSLGANCYLSKPSDLDSFFSTILSAAEFWLNFPTAPSPNC